LISNIEDVNLIITIKRVRLHGFLAYSKDMLPKEMVGGGYGWIQEGIFNNLSLTFMVILIFAKILATSFTTSSGEAEAYLHRYWLSEV
jgi:H+/Cl- antiporter ClcA